MRKIGVLFFLCFLLLNCTRTEARTKRHAKIVSKQRVQIESNDSLNLEQYSGNASWYIYRGGLFAASTEFKKGSVLRVINPVNNKYVDVVVNDYGPNRRKHPYRIIDLDKMAFEQIAQLKSGVINIIVCPLKTF